MNTPTHTTDHTTDHTTASTGAKRSVLFETGPNGYPRRYDLLLVNDVAARRMAETLGEGATKYGDLNWMAGFTETTYLAHAIAHLRRYSAGDRTEDHLAHAVWNLNALMWVEEKKPELMDLTKQLEKSIGLLNPNQVVRIFAPESVNSPNSPTRKAILVCPGQKVNILSKPQADGAVELDPSQSVRICTLRCAVGESTPTCVWCDQPKSAHMKMVICI